QAPESGVDLQLRKIEQGRSNGGFTKVDQPHVVRVGQDVARMQVAMCKRKAHRHSLQAIEQSFVAASAQQVMREMRFLDEIDVPRERPSVTLAIDPLRQVEFSEKPGRGVLGVAEHLEPVA